MPKRGAAAVSKGSRDVKRVCVSDDDEADLRVNLLAHSLIVANKAIKAALQELQGDDDDSDEGETIASGYV